MRETLILGGGRLQLNNVRMGRVNATSKRLQRFQADGIVGLGLESLSLITKPSLFASTSVDNMRLRESESHGLLSQFSVYVNPLPGHLPSSQLILGGVDASLVGGEGTVKWHHLPVIPYPDKTSHGFWSIRMHELAVRVDVDYMEKPAMRVSEKENGSREGELLSAVVSRNAVAIVDSGTSLLLFPTRVFNRTMQMIQRHLKRNYGLQMHNNEYAISGFACTACTPEMFPPLAFTFAQERKTGDKHRHGPKTLLLQGLDYVRCDGDLCMPQIDVHSLFGSTDATDSNNSSSSKSETPKPSKDVIVLGAIFMRAYYTVFNVQKRQVGFACTDNGLCQGGRNPKLQFHADFISDSLSFELLFWTRFYFSAGVMMLLIASVLLWTMVTTAKSSEPRTADQLMLASIGEKPRANSTGELEVVRVIPRCRDSETERSHHHEEGTRDAELALNRHVSWRKSVCFEV